MSSRRSVVVLTSVIALLVVYAAPWRVLSAFGQPVIPVAHDDGLGALSPDARALIELVRNQVEFRSAPAKGLIRAATKAVPDFQPLAAVPGWDARTAEAQVGAMAVAAQAGNPNGGGVEFLKWFVRALGSIDDYSPNTLAIVESDPALASIKDELKEGFFEGATPVEARERAVAALRDSVRNRQIMIDTAVVADNPNRLSELVAQLPEEVRDLLDGCHRLALMDSTCGPTGLAGRIAALTGIDVREARRLIYDKSVEEALVDVFLRCPEDQRTQLFNRMKRVFIKSLLDAPIPNLLREPSVDQVIIQHGTAQEKATYSRIKRQLRPQQVPVDGPIAPPPGGWRNEPPASAGPSDPGPAPGPANPSSRSSPSSIRPSTPHTTRYSRFSESVIVPTFKPEGGGSRVSFSRMSMTGAGPGGVIAGAELSDQSGLREETPVRLIYQPDRLVTGQGRLLIVAGEGLLDGGLVLAEDFVAAQRLVFGTTIRGEDGPFIVSPHDEGDTIVLASIDYGQHNAMISEIGALKDDPRMEGLKDATRDNREATWLRENPDFENKLMRVAEWMDFQERGGRVVVVHPAIADLTLGWDAIRADLVFLLPNQRRFISDEGLRARLRSLYVMFQQKAQTYKVMDVPAAIHVQSGAIDVVASDGAAALVTKKYYAQASPDNAAAHDGYVVVEKLGSEFRSLAPELVHASPIFERLNQFYRTMFVVRWAKTRGATAAESPGTPQFVVPDAVFLTEGWLFMSPDVVPTSAPRIGSP